MNYKKTAKIVGIIGICVVAVTFLYGRMNRDYKQIESKQEKTKQEDSKSENKQEKIEEKASEFPQNYQKKIDDKLEFDVEVICEEGIGTKGVSKATAFVTSLNQEKIYQYFMGEASNVQKETIDNYYDWSGNNIPLTLYVDNVGNQLHLAEKDVIYGRFPLTNYISNSFQIDKSAGQYNGDLYSKTSDMSFQSRSVAWEQLLEVMKELDIDWSQVNKKEVYSLDVETLQKEEECIDQEGNEIEEEKNPNWSKEDEGYYYYLGQQFQQIPIYEKQTVGRGGEDIETSKARIYQTMDGIAFFDFESWFTIQEQEEKYTFASFEQIMKVIEDKYTGTVMTNPLKVKTAKLYEYPLKVGENEYTLLPMWICTIEEEVIDEDGEIYIKNIEIPIHAVTGEEMIEVEE